MREIRLLSTRILVGHGLLAGAAGIIRSLAPGARQAFLMTDRNCRRYARRVESGLRASGFETLLLTLPPGEEHKSLPTAARIYDRMARFRMERGAIFVAVGGGVITDLGGFAASTYMRGLRLFLVPTTLLGQVDAAVGGKTAVNLAQGKNLVGTFYRPAAVLSDPAAFRTLPRREFTAGMAEVVKYGMIRDAGLLGFIEAKIGAIRRLEPRALGEIVFRCAFIKAEIVERDERESGLRAILNYGHTIGHGLETAGAFRKIHHGEAVAVGMAAEALLAEKMGLADPGVREIQDRLLRLCGLPVHAGKLPRGTALRAMELDKKKAGGELRFVLPDRLGRVRHGIPVPRDLVAAALRAVTS